MSNGFFFCRNSHHCFGYFTLLIRSENNRIIQMALYSVAMVKLCSFQKSAHHIKARTFTFDCNSPNRHQIKQKKCSENTKRAWHTDWPIQPECEMAINWIPFIISFNSLLHTHTHMHTYSRDFTTWPTEMARSQLISQLHHQNNHVILSILHTTCIKVKWNCTIVREHGKIKYASRKIAL